MRVKNPPTRMGFAPDSSGGFPVVSDGLCRACEDQLSAHSFPGETLAANY
jgi:hypothetical protein